MNVLRRVGLVTGALGLFVVGIGPQGVAAQQTVTRLVAEPASLSMRAGEELPFRVVAYDASGNVVPDAAVRVGGPRRSLFFGDGVVRAFEAGDYTAVATWSDPGATAVTLEIPVSVTWPALARVEIAAEPGRLYTDVMLAHRAHAFHADGSERPSVPTLWSSSEPSVASVDRFGNVTAHRPGRVEIVARVEGVEARQSYQVEANPVASIEIDIPRDQLLTGDVIHLNATALAADGTPVPDAPITWSYVYTPADTIEAPGGAGIIDWGRFAANASGRFTLLAHSGTTLARKVVEVEERDVIQRIEVTGRGSITSTHTSDLWPWTGVDGRDYALVGTWGGDGWALVFDITDLGNIVRTDSIQIDARTINDVTISPDGRYGVLAREGRPTG
jgi:hypothetical protein